MDIKSKDPSDSDARFSPAFRSARGPKSGLRDVRVLTDALLSGDRMALSKAITLIESRKVVDIQQASYVLERCHEKRRVGKRIGISGAPGVGKSTFIETMGLHIAETHPDLRIAVLAIDPSSKLSKGSILGDKTRMARLSHHPNVYIRPSPASDFLGGVGRHTQDTITVCEAAGFDLILIETVGVGQSEFLVSEMVDFFILLLLPGAGDEVQGIKRGIVELADLIAINKADGDHKTLAEQTQQAYKRAVHLLKDRHAFWNTAVRQCSALETFNIDAIWQDIEAFYAAAGTSLAEYRKAQDLRWFDRRLRAAIGDWVVENRELKDLIDVSKQSVQSSEWPVYLAIQRVMDHLRATFSTKSAS